MARRSVRIALAGLAGLIVLAVIAGVVAVLRFDPNSLKPQIIAAVRQATGRELTLNGTVHLKPSLWPTVQLSDAALSNPPGFTGPRMATIQRLDLQLAIPPLLHHEVVIDSLVLEGPRISLEVNAAGQGNWVFTPQPAPAAPQAPHETTARTPTTVSVHALRIDDGGITYRDSRGRVTTLGVHRLQATESSPTAPIHLNFDGNYNGAAFLLSGDVGSTEALQQPALDMPWPVNLTLAMGTAKLSANGTLTQPLQGRGYSLTLDGSIPDLGEIAPLMPRAKLPPLHNLTFSAKLADTGAPIPDISSLILHVGATDLSAYEPGLHLEKLDLTAPKPDQPVHTTAAGALGNTPFQLTATTGALALLLPDKQPTSFPVDFTAQAAGAHLTGKGAIAQPATLRGVDISLTADIPDLAALTPLLHHRLPPLKSIAWQGRLTDPPGGSAQGAMLHDTKLTTPNGDIAGDLGVTFGQPPTVTANLQSTSIDADALLATTATEPAPTAPPPSPQSAPPPKPAASNGRIFPDTPLPFALLRLANADLTLSIGDLRTGGENYRAIHLHAVLHDGKLQLAPFAADLPAGRLAGILSADASQPAPPVAISLRAPGLAVAPLLAAARLPPYANGKLDVQADLHGTGASAHAIASTLGGTLALSMHGGTIDTALINRMLGPALEKTNLLGLLAHGGTAELRCFLLRANARNGVAEVRPLVLDTTLLSMDGDGAVNLGEETMDLHLRQQGRVGGTGFVIPLTLSGPIRAPRVTLNTAGAAEENAGTALNTLGGKNAPLGAIIGALTGNETAGAEPCGPAPAATHNQPAPAPAKPPNLGGILHQLFR